MFTGIIESLGNVISIRPDRSNYIFEIESAISGQLKIDQSVAHNGVCLTVTEVNDSIHSVTAIAETMQRSTMGKLTIGSLINLERCMLSNGRFDGHVVQGHVDQTAVCTNIKDQEGSMLLDFDYDAPHGNITVEKGSICINGVSLTCINSTANSFSVALIPYTWEHTNFKKLRAGDDVNLEFDIIGKYVQKIMSTTTK